MPALWHQQVHPLRKGCFWSARIHRLSLWSVQLKLAVVCGSTWRGPTGISRKTATSRVLGTFRRFADSPLLMRWLPTSAMVGVALLSLTACGRPQSAQAALIGQWEKDDERLPPISLTLTTARDGMVARLRLSGSEWHGTAVLDGTRLTMSFPNRPKVIGQLVAEKELTLRFDVSGPDYTLTRISD